MNKQGKKGIEYLDYTFNPITGCLHPCKDQYCYAAKIAKRFGGGKNDGALHYLGEPMYKERIMTSAVIDPYPFGFAPTFHRYRLEEPRKVKKSSVIGMVYMGDMFGDFIPDGWIEEVFNACEKAPWHTYIFLTKNPKRYEKVYDLFPEKARCIYGATITCQNDIDNISNDIKPFLDFVSVEPLLGEININDILYWNMEHYSYIPGEAVMEPSHATREKTMQWVILGQQTNTNKPPEDEWVQSIIDQCMAAGVPVFVKSPLYNRFPMQECPKRLRG
jgi:protein gp37